MKNWFALLCALPLVTVAAPERIVALGGDVTEIVYASARSLLWLRATVPASGRRRQTRCLTWGISAS